MRPSGTEPFLAFELVFRGEHVVGEGGPWRQFFTDVAKEMQDPEMNCPLLMPSPNMSEKAGNQRDRFILKPSASSALMLELYEFLGLLFGCCIRTGVRLPLDLPSFVWKPLVNQALTRQDLDDVDHQLCQILEFIETCDAASFSQLVTEVISMLFWSFSSSFFFFFSQGTEFCSWLQTFTCKLSDRTTVELKSGGSRLSVTYESRIEYVDLVVSARLNEHRQQIEAIRRGINKIVPVQVLNILSWKDLEALVSGPREIDVDLLRRHTSYSKTVSPDAPHIEMFWSVLKSFDQDWRRGFIRFAWAQERLPSSDEEMIRSHTRLLIKPSPYPVADRALPRADTCFFNLELPAYSSEEIMRSKLIYAISSGVTMNADTQVEDIYGRVGRSNRGAEDL